MSQLPTPEDISLMDAIAEIIEPPKPLPKTHNRDRLAAIQARHLARSKAARILALIAREERDRSR